MSEACSPMNQPIELFPIFRERVWGRQSLAPWFPVVTREERIGEVWFSFEENSTSVGLPLGELISQYPEILGAAADPNRPGACPLLLKLLFTSERLSVQVHPDDAYAQQHHRSLGKTEAWYVLDAQASGEVAVGLREHIARERLKSVAESGEIENLLDWRRVKAGDVIFVPAGTVHAIGAGLAICEIQENSDITYRLYDYGRGRELDLDHGIAVSHLGPHNDPSNRIVHTAEREQLVACAYFRIERLQPAPSLRIPGGLSFYALLLCVKGSGAIRGEPVRAGQAWMIPAYASDLEIRGDSSEWILTYTADEQIEPLTA